MDWWSKVVVFPLRRLWIGVATRLGIRQSGILKLRHVVRSCESEDVRVMWEMLKRTDRELTEPSTKKPKRALFKVAVWARSAPHFCRTF